MLENILNGYRVIDLTQNVAGLFGTQIFGDISAEVIKIEQPGSGATTRAHGARLKPAASLRSTWRSTETKKVYASISMQRRPSPISRRPSNTNKSKRLACSPIYRFRASRGIRSWHCRSP